MPNPRIVDDRSGDATLGELDLGGQAVEQTERQVDELDDRPGVRRCLEDDLVVGPSVAAKAWRLSGEALIRPPDLVGLPGSLMATSARACRRRVRCCAWRPPSVQLRPPGDTTTTDPASRAIRVSRRGGQKNFGLAVHQLCALPVQVVPHPCPWPDPKRVRLRRRRTPLSYRK